MCHGGGDVRGREIYLDSEINDKSSFFFFFFLLFMTLKTNIFGLEGRKYFI